VIIGEGGTSAEVVAEGWVSRQITHRWLSRYGVGVR